MASVAGEGERHLGNAAGVHRATEMLHTSLCGREKCLHLGQLCPCQRAAGAAMDTHHIALPGRGLIEDGLDRELSPALCNTQQMFSF